MSRRKPALVYQYFLRLLHCCARRSATFLASLLLSLLAAGVLAILTVGAPQTGTSAQKANRATAAGQAGGKIQQTTPAPSTLPALPALTVSKAQAASDLAQRVARFQRVKVPFSSAGLTHNQRKMIVKLVDAAGLIDCIYWRQSDPEGLELYVSLAKSKDPQDVLLREYLKINGSRFDLFDNNKPFVGGEPMPPGRGLYWNTFTRDYLESFVKQNPALRAGMYSPYTLVEQRGLPGSADVLAPYPVPYHVAFKDFLGPMAQDLREAADLSDDDPAFGKFLRLRAAALLSDNYYASDVAWLDLQNPKIDVVFAPYETYLDGLLGIKTSYGAAIMIRNEAESQKLAIFQKYVPDLQEALPLPAEELPSKRGKQSPMEVMDAVYRAGDLLHGYQAVADNLPNDPRIHEEKGTKKIFWKNFMEARLNYVILPLAQRVLRQSQAQQATGEGYLDDTMMHEIAHGLGPAYARTATGRVNIREAIGPQYSALEESKADIVGMFCLKWLIDHGALPKEKEQLFYASYVAGIFRTARFGTAEAHAAGEMMQFNYLVEQGAIRLAPGLGGVYEIDFDKMPAAMASLAKELLEQEATGDRARAEAWFKRYAVAPAELSAAFAKATDIPVDIDPDFAFNPPVMLEAPAPAPAKAREE